jgi:DNA methylase
VSFSGLYPDRPLAVPFTGRPAKVARRELNGGARGAKTTAIYLAHSYPTKVPPEAIEPFVRHFTRPGDVVCDPFAGSGMTGVAARRLGRHAVLSDLSPLAVHLASNVNTYCSPTMLEEAGEGVLALCAEAFDGWYSARCTRCGSKARLEWLLWGETVACPECALPVRLWDAGFDRESGVMDAAGITCPSCKSSFPRRGARVVESAPVWASVSCLAGCGRVERPALFDDMFRVSQIADSPISDWYPNDPIDRNREMYIRSALALHGVERLADFYTPRNLRALARMWGTIQAWPDTRMRQALTFAFTNTAWHGTRMRRFNARGGQRPLTGTLYIPQMSVEVNVGAVFRKKIQQLVRFYETEQWSGDAVVNARLASATNLSYLQSNSVDYVFTDPPFGSNLFYGDCALIGESWLGQLTDVHEEAVVNRSLKVAEGGKTVGDYRTLMTSAFSEVARVLKKNGTATVVFQNTDPEVWQALEDALDTAGLICQRANTLDKGQQSHKGYKGRSGAEDVAGFDMILTVKHKPVLVAGRKSKKPTDRGVADAVGLLRDHLSLLPPTGISTSEDRKRTLPYLYSLLLEAHFNGEIGLQERGYACVRELCSDSFHVDAAGRWYVAAAKSRSDKKSRIKARLPAGV